MNYVGNDSDNVLKHYGVGHLNGGNSGRYPWGSGKDPYQTSGDWYSRYRELHKQGLTDAEIGEQFGLSSNQLRAFRGIAVEVNRRLYLDSIHKMMDEGMNINQIGQKMGINDTTIRGWLKKEKEENQRSVIKIAEDLEKVIKEKGIVDIGEGAGKDFAGVNETTWDQVITLLEAEGYPVRTVNVPMATSDGKKANKVKAIGVPGTEAKEFYEYENIKPVVDYDLDSIEVGETSMTGFKYPSSMDSKRLKIRYKDEVGPDGYTGEEKDGTIEIRRGVEDLDLGNNRYAQVRILVDNSHYLKGMAYYSDDIPEGYDVVFNTNKSKETPALGDKNSSVLKPIEKIDPNDPYGSNNPFGSLIKPNGGQSEYIGADGKKHLSLINKRAEEGDWADWKDELSAQFLSKQPKELIAKQLKNTLDNKKVELDAIMKVDQPTLKKLLLENFADECDKQAIHLKASALPGQHYSVILPMNFMSENEVYCERYNNGEKVALIRYPHAGTFEIPVLTVNNKNKTAKKMVGGNADAAGINAKVAHQLSGADFDGDTVMMIPLKNSKIESKKPFQELLDFEPKYAYPEVPKMKVLAKGAATNKQMGSISNLITDMTVKGATDDEIIRAVKHSMVVIDAAKHRLNYQQSYIDNGIGELKKKYQEGGGASTLISAAKSPVRVPKTKYDYETKTRVADTYIDKNGKLQVRTESVPKLSLYSDAFELSSGTYKESLYARYSNSLRAIANDARKAIASTPSVKYSKAAANTYATEVNHLKAQLSLSEQNKVRERQAKTVAASAVQAKAQSYKAETGEKLPQKERRKLETQALNRARLKFGAKRVNINITDKDWEAIKAGAVHESTLAKILRKTDLSILKDKSMPKTKYGSLTSAEVSRIKALKANGYSSAQIADQLGKSESTINKIIGDMG